MGRTVVTLSLVSINVLAGRKTTLDVFQCMDTSNPSLRNKSLRARNKVAHVELLREFARPVPQYAVTVTYGNIKVFLSSEKRAKLETKKSITPTFEKSFF